MRYVLLSPCKGRAAGCRLVGVVAGWLAEPHASWGVCIQAVVLPTRRRYTHIPQSRQHSCWSHTRLNAVLTCLTAPAGALVCCDLSRGSGAAAATTVFSSLTDRGLEQDCLTQVVHERVLYSMILPSAALMGVHADSSARCRATEMCVRTVRCRHHGPQLHRTHYVLDSHENVLGQHDD